MLRFALFSVVSISTVAFAAPQPQPFQRQLVFEPNRGQAPVEVKWLARGSGGQLFVTGEGVTFMLADRPAAPGMVRMKLTGGKVWNETSGLAPTGGISNYFLGNNPKRWRTGIPHYARLSAVNVYDGVDLLFYSQDGDLEYDFVVAPGADPKQIRLAFEGVDRMRIDHDSGDLLLTTAGGSQLRHVRPKVYQQMGDRRVEVASGYEILDRRQATFTLAAYDRRKPLIIDPTVKFTVFLAGNSSDNAQEVAVDSSGNAYVTGYTLSTNFPLGGAMQGDQPEVDAFVTKLSPAGAILFSTYLGGGGRDVGAGIAVDSTGVFVTGDTDSVNFPNHESIFPNRGRDAFLAKLSLAGNNLIYCGYLGGSDIDFAGAVAVDSNHAAWVVGVTYSSDFPIIGGPGSGQQRTYGGSSDAFLLKMAPSGLFVEYTTYLGGSSFETGYDVAVNPAGSVYATGQTSSANFPTTTGLSCPGAFVVRLTANGLQRRFSTCLGPGEGYDIAVDANSNAYVTGSAIGPWPATPGAFQTVQLTPHPNHNAFVMKLAPLGAVIYSTYLGGSDGSTTGAEIAIDGSGAAYVAGFTSSTRFPGAPPLTPNPTAGFVSKLSPQGNSLFYSTLLGAAVSGVAVFQRISRLPVYYPPQIYTTGFRYTGGVNWWNEDAFVVKLEEPPVNQQ